jgi:hypothetical protein
VEETVIVSVDSLKARKAGVEPGMKVLQIKQGDADIWAEVPRVGVSPLAPCTVCAYTSVAPSLIHLNCRT